MRKVELLGCGRTQGVVPAFDPQAERWGMNRLMILRYGGQFENWGRWFDLHTTPQIQARRPEAYRWYQAQTKPIYRWEIDPDVPASVAYPVAAVWEAFPESTMEFRCSLSWMLALAILEGFEEIDLFWHTLYDDEHRRSIPSILYWIGMARGRGIAVTIHGDSALVPDGPRYGLET